MYYQARGGAGGIIFPPRFAISGAPGRRSARVLRREQNILRVKGYVAVEGKPMRLLVQAVGARVRQQFDRPWGGDPRAGHLVVIAEHDDINLAAIRDVLGA